MYTSKNTSINSKRTPKGFSLLHPYGKVMDYGAGKYWKINEAYCLKKGAVEYIPYDPYNIEDNIEMKEYYNYFDTIYCTNVLNVLHDKNDIETVIINICKLLKYKGCAIFTVYEGTKRGIGKETKPDCWQRNQRLKEYRWYFYKTVPINFDIFVTSKYIKVIRTQY